MTDIQPKLITPVGQYDRVEWPGRNVSGIKPFGDRVLVLPDQPATKIGSIIITPAEIERVALAAETGVLVAQGDGAWYWNSDRTRKYEGEKPVAGQRVYFERYAGAQFHGRDGVVYRLMDDKAIGGIAVEPEGEPVAMAGPAAHEREALALQEALTGPMGRPDPVAAEIAALPEVEAPPLVPEQTPVMGDPNTAPLLPTDPPQQPAGAPAPIEPKFPRYTVKDGQTLMAFSRADMKDKAPSHLWFDTAEEAKSAGGN